MKEFEAFQTMDEATRQKLLEGVEDCITPALEDERKFLESRFCPRCDTRPCRAIMDARISFTGNGILPKKLLVCENCNTVFDPNTDIIVTLGYGGVDDQAMERILMHNYPELGIEKKPKIP